ncbi:hypothetical protein MNV49_007041 [Pseudohyphozyma bogoriensis]|nr:hypothetical protein MNV49_007041 [Pseudohyphozyma bogoriensis]
MHRSFVSRAVSLRPTSSTLPRAPLALRSSPRIASPRVSYSYSTNAGTETIDRVEKVVKDAAGRVQDAAFDASQQASKKVSDMAGRGPDGRAKLVAGVAAVVVAAIATMNLYGAGENFESTAKAVASQMQPKRNSDVKDVNVGDFRLEKSDEAFVKFVDVAKEKEEAEKKAKEEKKKAQEEEEKEKGTAEQRRKAALMK